MVDFKKIALKNVNISIEKFGIHVRGESTRLMGGMMIGRSF